MNIHNHVQKTLINNKQFIFDVTQASEKLFNSIDDVFFSGNDREVKILRNVENSCIYIFDKHNENLNVYLDNIEDFQKNDSTKSLLYYTNQRLVNYEKKKKQYDNNEINSLKREDDNGDLYSLIIHGSKRSEFLKQINNGDFPVEKRENTFEDEIQKMKNSGLEQAFINKILNIISFTQESTHLTLDEQYDFRCSSHVDILKNFLDMLNEKGFLTYKKDNNFFKSLNNQGYAKRDQTLPSLWESINYFTDVCQNNELLSYENKFNYNDSDNSIFMHNEHLIMADQTCGYYFDIKDKSNYTIYFLEKEYKGLQNEINRIESTLKYNTIDELKDIVLEVKNGKTAFQNDGFMYVLELCLTYAPKAMKSEGLKLKLKRKTKI